MRVLEKRAPLAKAQIGSDEGGLFLVPPLHEGKENPHLNGFDLDIANFVNEQAVVGEVFGEQGGFGVIGDGLVELADQLRKENVTAAIALVDGMG